MKNCIKCSNSNCLECINSNKENIEEKLKKSKKAEKKEKIMVTVTRGQLINRVTLLSRLLNNSDYDQKKLRLTIDKLTDDIEKFDKGDYITDIRFSNREKRRLLMREGKKKGNLKQKK